MTLNKTKAIFLDAGGTLFRPYTHVGHIYAETAKHYGVIVNGDEVEEKFHKVWLKKSSLSALESTRDERLWWYELVKEVFLDLGEIKDFEHFFTELHELFAKPEIWVLYPEVGEVLETLRQEGYVLGVVSNWDSRLIPLCEKLNISHHFHFILASALVESSKPHPGIFREALKHSDVEPHEALHVGDSLKDDYEGPRAIGIRSVLIDREFHDIKNGVEQISTLRDIFKYL